ncbi:hypothetical protein JMJ56_31740 [Belnapia sp. T18]|uniref:Uncharacterized protein n=2 Tax=Belnapia arida TaxID=2804533 RepID=A0ABS1UEY2_9PROT|nr:hypothetical protein [Belnapia arida]
MPSGGAAQPYRGDDGRGAIIDCLKAGHVCLLRMPGHPLDSHGFGVVGTITPLVDLWVEEQRLPKYMRAVPMAKS